MKKFFYSLLCFSLFFSCSVFADTPSFIPGKDYQVIDTPIPDHLKLTTPNKVTVVEFFNYGCPACYNFDPTVIAWSTQQPKNVEFDRVPVVFHPGWQLLAKAYYAAKVLNELPKIHSPLFKAIHAENTSFNNEKELEVFFIKQGILKEDFESVFEFSPGMEAQIQKSQELMNTYKIFEIPALLINGKYKTNLRMVGGDSKKLMQVVNFLIAKEQKNNR